MSGCTNINITANAAPAYRLCTVVLITEYNVCSVTTLLHNNMILFGLPALIKHDITCWLLIRFVIIVLIHRPAVYGVLVLQLACHCWKMYYVVFIVGLWSKISLFSLYSKHFIVVFCTLLIVICLNTPSDLLKWLLWFRFKHLIHWHCETRNVEQSWGKKKKEKKSRRQQTFSCFSFISLLQLLFQMTEKINYQRSNQLAT